MFKSFGVVMFVAGSLSLAGCNEKVVSVDVSHVYTDLGYLNSSSANLGYLYLWDQQNGTLTQVDIIDFSPSNMFETGPTGASRRTSSTRGASVSAGVSGLGDIAPSIEAEVDRRMSIEVNNYVVRSTRATIDEMASRIRAAPEDIAARWFLRKAVSENNRYLYVLTYKSLSSDSAQLEIDRSASVSATVPIESVSGGVEAKLEGSGLDRFEGRSVPAFLGYYVMRPFINTAGNYDFDVVTTAYRKDLIATLRNSAI
jgi:hypothetical protein